MSAALRPELVTGTGQARAALTRALATFQKWLGAGYDSAILYATLATLAAERLAGDPVWLLIVSGPGAAKTETAQAAIGAGAHVVSTISSEGALLSATSAKGKSRSATGGLLRAIGERGVIVIKDATSIIAMHRETRGALLAALREIHDGRWVRNVGTDGGQTLEWQGRIAVIGAVTTAWDRAHDVISACGDRFVLVRLDSSQEREAAGRQALANIGSELAMRAELAHAVADCIAAMDTAADLALMDRETETLLAAADLVTRARTGVEFDYRGDPIDAHAPEMPTRFAKQLAQLMRGGIALGMSRAEALQLAIRCARDSMPPLRLALLLDLAAHPYSSTTEVRKRLDKPRATVDRQLQVLHLLGLLTCDEESGFRGTVWRYTVAEGVRPEALEAGASIGLAL